MFCSNCGTKNQPGSKFCIKCGASLNNIAPDSGEHPPKKKKPSLFKKIIIILLALVVLLIIIGIIGSLDDDHDIRKGELKLGDTFEIASGVYYESGGMITVDKNNSTLKGMTLNIPKGAYLDKTNFIIEEIKITEHSFGKLFNPITPLIKVDNNEIFAKVPMILTIPIKISDDEFAMAFFYDEKNNTLEGIPTLELSNNSITIATSHFSYVVVSKIKKQVLEENIEKKQATTSFLPGKDDFYATNYGSFIAKGHCAGQSIAMMHYFTINFVKNNTNKSLRMEKIIDNNSYVETPDMWQDDSLAYRLCSAVQKEYENRWYAGLIKIKENYTLREDVTYYSFAYAMALTKSPQYIDITGEENGVKHSHAMVVYDVSPNGLSIADPNKPGNTTRKISVNKLDKPDEKGSKIDIGTYNAGDNADSNEITYTKVAYIGTYALVEYNVVDRLWKDMLSGKDVGLSYFPEDYKFITMVVDKTSGKINDKNLEKTHSISSDETKVIDSSKIDHIYITVPKGYKGDLYTIYNGTNKIISYKDLGQNNKSWAVIPLNKGSNQIGIYLSSEKDGIYKYINFYRFEITLTDEPLVLSFPEKTVPEPTVTTETTPKNEKPSTPTPAPSPKEYDYNAALAAWVADFTASQNKKTFDDGKSKTTCTLEWVKTPFIKDGAVYGAHKLWYTDVFYSGPKAGTTEKYVATEMYDANTPGEYISVADLKKLYPQY